MKQATALVLFFLPLLAIGGAAASSVPEPPAAIEAAVHGGNSPPPESTISNERAAEGLFMLANHLVEKKEFRAAETAYEDALRIPTSAAFRERALLAYARMLRESGRDVRAVAMFQRFLADHPLSEDAAMAHLTVGRVMREMGLIDGALGHFYAVLNATLKIPSGELASYRNLTQVAMFEIAETHFSDSNFDSARKAFGRITLLDLPDSDRARAMYREAHSYYLSNDLKNAVRAIRQFTERYPDDPNTYEARHYLCVSLRKLNRTEEALQETLELLRRIEGTNGTEHSSWGYWQRRTGNQLANDFYQQGDFQSAMKIYERLSAMRSDPGWRWPALYQYGLCLERLKQTSRAIAAFRTIAEEAAAAGTLEGEAADIARMANWRMKHLGWNEDLERQILALNAPDAGG